MTEKITRQHLERPAVIYVRQSTPQQVVCNEESRRLQYAMKDRLHELGWSEVEVIADDLGRTASGTAERPGFERMVTRVSLGELGLWQLARFPGSLGITESGISSWRSAGS